MGKATKPASMRPVSTAGRKKGQTRARLAAEKRSTYYAVCLIGFSDLLPRRLGDNMGSYPVTVVTLKSKEGDHRLERLAVKNVDRGQPLFRTVLLEHCLVPTEAHAKRLKTALLRALLGQVEDMGNDPSRHSFRDVVGCFDVSSSEERALWWATLLDDASQEVQRTIRGFKVRTNQDREADILRYLQGGKI